MAAVIAVTKAKEAHQEAFLALTLLGDHDFEAGKALWKILRS